MQYKRFAPMKKLFLILNLVLYFSFLNAQSYDFAGGIRFGTGIGFSFKYQPIKKMTIEAIVASSLQKEEVQITALFARHNSLITKGFNFYVGAGAQKGFTTNENPTYEDPSAAVVIVGAEFSISRLNISYDILPAYNIVGGDQSVTFETGVSLRYIFDKKKLFEDREKNQEKRKKDKAKKKKKKLKAKEKAKASKKQDDDKKWWQF